MSKTFKPVRVRVIGKSLIPASPAPAGSDQAPDRAMVQLQAEGQNTMSLNLTLDEGRSLETGAWLDLTLAPAAD